MQLTLLGTSCMVPTKERNVSGHFLSYKGEGILFDCGEGTQRQMNSTGIKRTSVTKILISHWHGDHVSGLLGLIQTVGNEEGEKKIMLFGPKGTAEKFGHLTKSIHFDTPLNIVVKEVDPKSVETVFESEDFLILCAPLNHGIPCNAYAFVEKDKHKIDMEKAKKFGLKEGPWLKEVTAGKKIVVNNKAISPEEITWVKKGRKVVYVADTGPAEHAQELAQDADVLLCEATYTHEHIEKARKYNHLTAREAAQIASQAGVKKLVLTHFSQRYKNVQEIEEDARTVFPNTVCGYDLMKIKL